MKDELMDIRTSLARSPNARVEVGSDGVLHILAGPITLHVDRSICEELAGTLARAMIALRKVEARSAPALRLVGAQTQSQDTNVLVSSHESDPKTRSGETK